MSKGKETSWRYRFETLFLQVGLPLEAGSIGGAVCTVYLWDVFGWVGMVAGFVLGTLIGILLAKKLGFYDRY